MSDNGLNQAPALPKKLVYTSFGYGHIFTAPPISPEPPAKSAPPIEEQKEADPIQTVHMRSGAIAYIPLSSVKTTISVNLKTFFGPRKTFKIEVNINDSIESIKEKLIQADESKEAASPSHIRLIYPIGKLRELPSSLTVEAAELPHNCTLIVLTCKGFAWNEERKGSDIVLSNMNLTAAKGKQHTHEYVIGTTSFSLGKHYFEVTIDIMDKPEDVIVGVCLEDLDISSGPSGGQPFWGLLCGAAKKLNGGGEGEFIQDFGEAYKMGDSVGIMLEIGEDCAKMTCYRNRKSMGVAFAALPPATFFPALCLYYGGAQASLKTNVRMPGEGE